MRKILSLVLGLLWVVPVWGVDYSNCQNLFDGEYISVSDGHKAENANNFYVSPGERYVALWTTYTPAAINLYGYNTQGNQVGSWSSGAYAPNGVSTPFSDNYMAWQKGAVFTVPDGVAYLRFNTFGNLSASQQQAWAESLKIYNMDCVDKIKIATTKYNESAFSPLNTALQNAISVVDTVVSNTITQAGRIATLQTQKQTRPNDIADDNEKCPAGKKCLLVEDASGIPHWYEIVENAWDLPAGYTQLQYLRSDGRAYINTNYSPTSKTRIELVAKVDSGAGNINIVGSGRRTTGDAGNALLAINSWGDNTAEIKFAPTGAWIRSENVNMLEKNRLSLSATKFSVNGDVKETDNKTIPDTDNQPFYIFQRWRPSIESTNSKTQVYEFSIYENDILVRNMIPVKRNSDGAIGMFDTVNDVFYTNAGTGEFIAGDPVAE